MESSRSNEDHRDKVDDDKRSRASSTSDKFPASACSPSPIHSRRRGSATASPNSQRASRSSVTSSSRSSTSTKPATPPHVTTVIAVESPTSSGLKSSSKDNPPNTEAVEATVGAPANTHIIKVSGPVTNLDETVTSATEVPPPSPPPSPTSSARSSRSSSPKVIQTSV